MTSPLSRKSIIQKTMQIGASTLLSRILGFVREILQIKYLGVGPLSDAFLTAFRIPNSLRKIFADGALSAAFIPTFVTVYNKQGLHAATALLITLFAIIESLLAAFCMFVAVRSDWVMYLAAPGWLSEPTIFAEQLLYAQLFLKILIFYIVFISSSSLIAGALNGLHRFAVPAYGQSLMNFLYILELLICLRYKLPVQYLAFAILCNGAVLLALHIWAYYRLGGELVKPNKETWAQVRQVLKKFLPCLVSVGAVEINIFIDQMLASYLPQGSVSLMYYTWSFIRIPIGVFAVALSTILLPQFTRIHTTTPRRLNFYLFESIKLVAFVTIPCALLIGMFSYQAFYTLFLSPQFTLMHVMIAQKLMIAFAIGLFFFCLNKILLSMFYALHETFISTIISLATTLLNTLLNIILMKFYGVWGIALATSVAAGVQTVLFLWVLRTKFNFNLYLHRHIQFMVRFTLLLSSIGVLAGILYKTLMRVIMKFCSQNSIIICTTGLGYWAVVLPVVALALLALWFTRKYVGIKLYFID